MVMAGVLALPSSLPSGDDGRVLGRLWPLDWLLASARGVEAIVTVGLPIASESGVGVGDSIVQKDG